MIEDATRQRTEHGGPGVTPGPGPMAACPMASMCKGMMGNPTSGLPAVLVGLVLIVVGALILVEPRIVVWLAGAVLILIGVMLLVISKFIRRLGGPLRDT